MPMVFISYNRKDGKYARALRDQIAARGIEVFFDVDSIAPSQQFPQATADSIAKCDLFLLLWSRNAAQSKFVTDEWNIAIAQKKAIFPVLLESDFFLPPALCAINAWPAIAPPKLANRIVGLLVGDIAVQPVPITQKRSKWQRWMVVFSAITFIILAIVITRTTASTWKANFSLIPAPAQPPKDTNLYSSTNKHKQVASIRPSLKEVSGKICDSEDGRNLAGVAVCIDPEHLPNNKKNNPCFTTNDYGRYEFRIQIEETNPITITIDGTAVGYRRRTITIDPDSKSTELNYFLEKI